MSSINILNVFSEIALGTEFAAEIVEQMSVDASQIQAKQPASISIPSIGGSIEGVPGKFTGSITFTPNT
jgi:hypothetical protein